MQIIISAIISTVISFTILNFDDVKMKIEEVTDSIKRLIK